MATLTASDPASLGPAGTRAAVPGLLLRPPALGLVADPLGLRRLEALLEESFEVVARAQDVGDLLGRAARLSAVILAGGAELCARGGPIEQLAGLTAAPAIVVVAKTDERSLVRRVLCAGAHGFVCETSAEVALHATVEAVLSGQLSVPRSIRNRIPWPTLSLREQQVLELVAEGMTNGEIAYRLCLSESTVKTHLSSSFRKLGVSSRAEAAALVLDPHGGLRATLAPDAAISLERELLGAAPTA